MNQTDELRIQHEELKQQEKSTRHHFYYCNSEAKRYAARVRLIPDDEDAVVKAAQFKEDTTKAKQAHDDICAALVDLQHQLDSLDAEQRRAVLALHAGNMDFDIPNDDPFFEALMLTGVASSLQYWYVNTTSYYEHLIRESYTRTSDDGQDTGGIGEDKPNPEIVRDALDKVEELRSQREYVQTLRFSVEQAYNAAVAKMPDDARFIPKLVQRSDDQLADFLDQRKGKARKSRVDSRQAAIDKSIAMARKADEDYKPTIQEDEREEISI